MSPNPQLPVVSGAAPAAAPRGLLAVWTVPVGVVVLVALLLVGGVQLYGLRSRISDASHLLQQTQSLGSTLREIHVRYLQAVSSLRLYVASRNPLQALDYEDGTAALAGLIDRGTAEAAREPDPLQRSDIGGLMGQLVARIEQMRLARATFQAEGLEKLVEATRRMDTDQQDRRVKERLAKVLEQQESLTQERAANLQRIDSRFQWVLVGFLGLSSCLIIILFLRGHREWLRRRQTDEALREAARALQKRTVELEQANRDLESFTFTVSHDLRSPLRIVAGYAALLEEDHGPGMDDDARLTVRRIREAAQRLGTLISDLLAFSRLGRESLTMSAIPMEQLVREVWEETLAVWPGSRADLQLGPLPSAVGDARLVRQVWANLLDNGVKYSSQVAQPRIEVSGSSDGEYVRFEIRDNGIGFDMKDAGKVFMVFQRLVDDVRFSGTGAGLAIVRRIVERHGGEVWVETAVGEGASFGFSLRAAHPAAAVS
jgi:signal transduction histidine kinase